MAASDWDADPTNNASVTFPDIGGGDNAMLINCYPEGDVEHAYFFQKTHSSMKNTEVDFNHNIVDENLSDYFMPLYFRWDIAQDAGGSGYRCYFRKFFSFPSWYIRFVVYKVVSGSPTLLAESGNLEQWNLNNWRRMRIRCWDLVFPAGAVKFSVERWTGASWTLLYTFTDTTGAFFNTLGRVGFGAIGKAGATNQRLYINDFYIRW